MKVILTQTVPKVGKAGQVVSVADGFARNFLFPKRLATVADKVGLAGLERQRDVFEAEADRTRAGAEGVGGSLDGATVRVVGSTAKGSTKLFGSVTSADIAEAIKDQLGIEVEKRSIALMYPVKRLGVYEVLIDLHRDVDAHIRLEVADEEGNLGLELPVSERLPELDEALRGTEARAEAETTTEAQGEDQTDKRKSKTAKGKASGDSE